MKVFLTASKDGRVLVQSRMVENSTLISILLYVNQGQEYKGIPYQDLVKSTPGMLELPDEQVVEPPQPEE